MYQACNTVPFLNLAYHTHESGYDDQTLRTQLEGTKLKRVYQPCNTVNFEYTKSKTRKGLKKSEKKLKKRLETYTKEEQTRMRQEEEEEDLDDIHLVVETAADESACSDIVEEPVNKEFLATTFWKVEDQYNIDDLLADFEE